MHSHRTPARLLPQLSASADKGGRDLVGGGQTGYDIRVGPLSSVAAITYTTSPAICQQGRDGAGVKQSQEANGA